MRVVINHLYAERIGWYYLYFALTILENVFLHDRGVVFLKREHLQEFIHQFFGGGIHLERIAVNVNELGVRIILYKLPNASASKLVTVPVTTADEVNDVAKLSDDIRFAASVAAFGQKLRRNTFLDGYAYDEIVRLANGARGEDAFGYRAEFVNLVRLTGSMKGAGGTSDRQ